MGTPTRGCANAACPRPSPTLWGRHYRGRWPSGPSESPERCSASRWTRARVAQEAQSMEPIPGRPGRLARGPMAQPSCAWLKRRRESSGGRRGKEGGGDAMRRGLIGGVERGGAKRQLSYREASTGDVVRHAGGRGLSHRPPGRLEGPCSPRHEALLAGPGRTWPRCTAPR